ncbi:hypothetical protein BaRGS_00026464 [Batillaria attramentaria]|uniref:Uncharacterized protein n=1 Tax=Batillaria attramentaria TaxID=370345 RepID=A0ABD0K5X2_9CAEN
MNASNRATHPGLRTVNRNSRQCRDEHKISIGVLSSFLSRKPNLWTAGGSFKRLVLPQRVRCLSQDIGVWGHI